MRCGIDFGTSNTSMAVYSDADRQSRLVPLENGALTIPTALFFTEKNKSVLFGRSAVTAYLDGQEGRFMRSLKRVLGTSLMDSSVLVNGTRTSFDVIIGRFISHVKAQAEHTLGHELQNVVMGRPVFFQDNDAAADSRAQTQLEMIARQCGFKDIGFQYEPIAAALAHERHLQKEQLALVVDIGGGTSDFSVIRLDPQFLKDRDRKQDILANAGIRIGGNDCDKAINLDAMMPLLGLRTRYGDKDLDMPVQIYHELSEWAKINWCYTPQNMFTVRQLLQEAHEPQKIRRLETVLEHQDGHRIVALSEEMKIVLSEADQTSSDLGFVEQGLSATMQQAGMNALLDSVLEPVRRKMLDVLDMAAVTPEMISAVVLTGGSTGLPVFRKWITQYFKKADILEQDRLGSVGLGLVL